MPITCGVNVESRWGSKFAAYLHPRPSKCLNCVSPRAFSVPMESERGSSLLFWRLFFTRTGAHFARKRSRLMERCAPLIPRVQVCLVEDAKLLSRVWFSQWLRVVCAIPRIHPRVVSEFMGSFASCATSTDTELGQPSHLRNSKAQHSVHDSTASRNGFSDRHFTQPGWFLLMLCSPDYRPSFRIVVIHSIHDFGSHVDPDQLLSCDGAWQRAEC
jgi:hypothetical protein